MKLRRWAVMTMPDTPMRKFWMQRSARKFWNMHWLQAELFWWCGNSWIKLT